MSQSEANNEVIYGDTPSSVLCWLGGCLEDGRDKILVARGWCKKCGICMSICPVKALDRDEEGYPIVDNDKCISCGNCEIMCPDFAIAVSCLKEKSK